MAKELLWQKALSKTSRAIELNSLIPLETKSTIIAESKHGFFELRNSGSVDKGVDSACNAN